MKNKKFAKYFREYEWSNISAMIRNNRSDPKICTENFNQKLVVITGATSGIGYFTARKYASHGCKPFMHKSKSEEIGSSEEVRLKVNLQSNATTE